MERGAVSRLVGVLMAIGLLLGSVGAGPPAAEGGHIVCGATLGPGGSAVLDSDVGPCPGPTPGLRVVGPTQVDLNGFSVICQDRFQQGFGLEVGGSGAAIADGTVTNCSWGVLVGGSGRHRIQGVSADGNGGGGGFFIQSGQNQLHDNTASNNANVGFFLYANGNAVTGNLLWRNRADSNSLGFWLTQDARNSIVTVNTALSNGSMDMRDDNPNCDRNLWLRNTFVSRSQSCIR